MIKGKKRIPLTTDNVLKLISPYDIYRRYFGDFKINVVTKNWIRGDENPSFIIGNATGELHHFDFADGNWRGDCFSFVKQLYSLDSINDVLKLIDRDFGLGISSEENVGEYKKIVSQYKQPEEIKEKHYSIIQCVTRKFTNEELKYWNDYYQDIEDLKQNNVYSIAKAYLNRKLFPLSPSELRFGYLYENYWKLYLVDRPKRRKWVSNVPLSFAYGLSNLNKEHNTLITKSLKDYMVCKKIYPYVCHVQNESLGAFSEETVKYIKENSKEVFYGGDSDIPGKSASYIITEAFGFKHINPPDRLLEDCCKDFADWARAFSLKDVEEHFIKKGLKNY